MKIGKNRSLTPFLLAAGFCLMSRTAEGSEKRTILTTDTTTEAHSDRSSAERRFAISIAYFGETLTHPGVSIGGGYTLLSRAWFSLHTGPTMGYYLHIRNHHALFGAVNLGLRATTTKGFFGELGGGVGYLHTWLAGAVYELKGDRFVEVRQSGRPHLMVHGDVGFGWDYLPRRHIPVSWFFKIGCFGEYPYNTFMMPHFFVRIGVAYRFGR